MDAHVKRGASKAGGGIKIIPTIFPTFAYKMYGFQIAERSPPGKVLGRRRTYPAS
jgi:hypothetical protein